jgi:hypothetical protein
VKIVETLFRTPVSVCLQNGLEYTFQSVEDALDFLENEWGTRQGAHYRRAVDLCRAVLNRVAASETAREAFIAACIEGGIRLVQAPLGHSVRHADTRHAM